MKTHLILCPVDYSNSSDLAIELAGKLAHPGESKVILLHVIEPGSADEKTTIVGAMINDAKDRLRERGLFEKAVDLEHLTLKGPPGEVIVHFAKTRKADLIVMGTQGRTGLSKLLMGSVAQSVMQNAPCPVVTIKPPADNS
jgi:nucleotide-binding universal stress UspA family protein